MFGWRHCCSTLISRMDVTGMPTINHRLQRHILQLILSGDFLFQYSLLTLQKPEVDIHTISFPLHPDLLEGHHLPL